MRSQSQPVTQGSVLLVAILTLTILSMICGLSLYVTSQNTNATSQTASWQAALSGAESGVEHAYYALNKNTWTGWKLVSGSPPATQPTGGSSTTSPPTTGNYAYFTRTLQLAGEGGNTVKFWATVDTAGLPRDNHGNQWYRIRATGVATAPGPARVSNQKQDNDLRKISLRTDRLTGLAVTTPQAARKIEVIAKPVTTSIWSRALTLKNSLSMSGGGFIDSFDSSNSLYSSNHLYDPSRRLSHGDIGIVDSTGSDLKNQYLYGGIAYSGPAIKNTQNVQGSISTPFQASIPVTSNPSWAAGTYTSLPGGSPPVLSLVSGTKNNPVLVKINGDFKVSSGNIFTILAANVTTDDNEIIIWVTGRFDNTGNGQIVQDSHVKVTWYVDDDIKLSGNSYQNVSGYASQVNFIGVGSHTATITGNSDFIGTLNAPGYDIKIDGGGSFIGGLIASNLVITGGSSIHYDEALAANGNDLIGNYSYASWFEDIADAPRGSTY